MTRLLICVLLVVLAGCASAPEPQQQVKAAALCVDNRAATVRTLEKRYGEVCVRQGYTVQNIFVEVFENEKTETFTILYTYPQTGLTCFGAAGVNWTEPVKEMEARR